VSPRQNRRADAQRIYDQILLNAVGTLRAEPQASMNRIAHVAGVHRSTLYRHFPTREVLIEQLTERATAEGRALTASILQGEPCAASVRRLCEQITAFGEKYGFLIGTAAVRGAGADPIGLVPLMSRWQRADVLRGDVTAGILALSFTATAIALQESSQPNSSKQADKDRADVLHKLFVQGAAVAR